MHIRNADAVKQDLGFEANRALLGDPGQSVAADCWRGPGMQRDAKRGAREDARDEACDSRQRGPHDGQVSRMWRRIGKRHDI